MSILQVQSLPFILLQLVVLEKLYIPKLRVEQQIHMVKLFLVDCLRILFMHLRKQVHLPAIISAMEVMNM